MKQVIPIFIVLTFLSGWLSLYPVTEKKTYHIQELSLGNDKKSLEPDNEHTWWCTLQDIDPVLFSEALLSADRRNIRQGKIDNLDMPGNGWQAVNLPANLTSRGIIPTGQKRAWFLKTFYVTNNPQQNYALRLGVITDRDKTYFNGVLIGESGQFGADKPQSYDKIRLYEIPGRLLRPGQLNVLLLHVEAYFDKEIGPISDEISIGPSVLMSRERSMKMLVDLLLLASYTTVALYFLFLFLRRPQERANLAFALFALVLVGYQSLRTQLKHELGLPFYPMKKTEYVMLQLLLPMFFIFIRTYFIPPKNKFFLGIDIFSALPILGMLAVMCIVLLSSNVQLWDKVNNEITLNICFPLIVLAALIQVGYQLYKKNLDAWIMLAGILVMIAAAVVDTMSNRQIINLPRVAGYAFFLFIITLALILANKFVRVHNEVEDLNRNLEKKVAERTAELNESLQQIRALKEQQDGDYFLTSLLTDALTVNKVNSSTLQVDSLIYQKKEFTFKKWHKRIGGDFCVADSLILRGRPVTVFMNADAMGKSMQGAGGVLVLGSVWAAILERTRMSKRMADLYPEQWLRDAFVELNRIFESFNGSMMVSVVMGVIDDLTGTMFYMNAEHPFTVLYRDGKASFIEQELLLRKLGTVGVRGQLKILTLKLYPGDMIIAGSDGRDDIVISEDATSGRVINEDENLFLTHVEKSRGDLTALKQQIENSGALTDDLSLLKIEYHGGKTAEESSPHYETLEAGLHDVIAKAQAGTAGLEEAVATVLSMAGDPLKSLTEELRRLIKKKQLKAAAQLAESLHLLAPRNNEIIYLASFTRKLMGDFMRALTLGELLYLREPEQLKNLVNMADIALAMGDLPLAERYIIEAEEIYAGDEKVKRLRSAYEKRVTQGLPSSS